MFAASRDNRGDVGLGTHRGGAYRFNGTAFVRFRPRRRAGQPSRSGHQSADTPAVTPASRETRKAAARIALLCPTETDAGKRPRTTGYRSYHRPHEQRGGDRGAPLREAVRRPVSAPQTLTLAPLGMQVWEPAWWLPGACEAGTEVSWPDPISAYRSGQPSGWRGITPGRPGVMRPIAQLLMSPRPRPAEAAPREGIQDAVFGVPRLPGDRGRRHASAAGGIGTGDHPE